MHMMYTNADKKMRGKRMKRIQKENLEFGKKCA
jgi:hypothetical protein